MKRSILIASFIICILGCNPNRPISSSTANERARQNAPRINPEVRLIPEGVSVKNQDTFFYGATKLVLNMTEWGGGPVAYFAGLAPGRSVVVPYREFSEGTERFNYFKTKILTVVVRAEINGQKTYALLLFPNPAMPGVRAPEKAP